MSLTTGNWKGVRKVAVFNLATFVPPNGEFGMVIPITGSTNGVVTILAKLPVPSAVGQGLFTQADMSVPLKTDPFVPWETDQPAKLLASKSSFTQGAVNTVPPEYL